VTNGHSHAVIIIVVPLRLLTPAKHEYHCHSAEYGIAYCVKNHENNS